MRSEYVKDSRHDKNKTAMAAAEKQSRLCEKTDVASSSGTTQRCRYFNTLD